MQLIITAKQLIDLEACDKGVEAFREVFGDEAIVEWSVSKQIEVLRTPLGKYFGWAFAAGLLPMWSLRSANLRLANLRSADLSSADLSSADLSSANLSSANLDGARVCLCDNRPCHELREMLGRLLEKGKVAASC